VSEYVLFDEACEAAVCVNEQ